MPELILDSHLKVPDRRPRATLTTNLSADGLKRVYVTNVCFASYARSYMYYLSVVLVMSLESKIYLLEITLK